MKYRTYIDKFNRPYLYEREQEVQGRSATHENYDNQLKDIRDRLANHDKEMKEIQDKFDDKLQLMADSHAMDHNKLAYNIGKQLDRCLRLDENGLTWDAMNHKIRNLKLGSELTDASNVEQTCTYDKQKNRFRCGSTEFDLVQNHPLSEVVVVRYKTGMPYLAKYTSRDPIKWYFMTFYERSFLGGGFGGEFLIKNWKGEQIVWNEKRKRFMIRDRLEEQEKNQYYTRSDDQSRLDSHALAGHKS